MSRADQIFIRCAKQIVEEGTTNKGQEVRPHWPDGTPAFTKKIFGMVNRYDLREEFPAITLRKIAIRSAYDEILWIYQRKSSNVHDLKPHIWDEWADEEGSIGKAYGYQIGQKFQHASGLRMDQMDAVLYDLKHTPYSRRIMTSLWNFSDLQEMHLYPCCWNATFNVTDEGGDRPVLNMMLNQRSSDFLAANNWNVVQYAIFLMMVAQVSHMTPGVLLHVIADAHIYDRHLPIVEELISRPTFSAPIVELNPDIRDFYDFRYQDLQVKNYQTGPQVRFEVAI